MSSSSLSSIIFIMWTRLLLALCILTVAVNYHEASGFLIRNKLLGRCLKVHSGGRVALEECSPGSPLQEWRWVPGGPGGSSPPHHGGHAISNQHTGECLTAPRGEYEGVSMQACVLNSGGEAEDAAPPGGGGEEEMYMTRETGSSQAWTCTKKGLLSLAGGRGLHLSATQQSSLVFLSKDHKQGTRWRTLDNQTVCSERDSHHPPHHHVDAALVPGSVPSAMSNSHQQQPLPIEGVMDPAVTESPLNHTRTSSEDPTMVFFTMDYGMGWKITMLVLSSLALVLGTVILIVNVYANSRKKVVCVLKSYTPREEVSQPGSPVPNERAPLTKHAMRLPHSSPPLQRGEILIQWKDGTVTPLYEA